MIKEGKIGVQETIWLVMVAIGSKVFYTTPGLVTQLVGTAGWLMTLISNVTSIILFTFIYILLKRFPGKDIIAIFDITLGRFAGFIFSIIFAMAFLLISSLVVREFAETLKTYIFPRTPISLVIGSFIAVVAAASFLGFESIARISKLTAYVALFGYILLLILGAQSFKLENLFPIFGYGLDKVIINGVIRSPVYVEVIIIAVIAGSLQGHSHIKRAGYISLILSGIILFSTLLCLNLVLPYYTIQELTTPLYVYARLIKYGPFLQRMDPVFLLLWVFTSIISISILFYCSVSVYSKTFKLQDMKPIIIPMALLLFTIAMVPTDLTSVIKYIQVIRTYGSSLFYFLPLITLIISIIRKKRGENNASS